MELTKENTVSLPQIMFIIKQRTEEVQFDYRRTGLKVIIIEKA